MPDNCKNEFEIFTSNIAFIRRKYGISKKQMSKLLGISVRSLNVIEGGEMPPRLTADIIVNVWTEFHLRPSDLFERRLEQGE